VRRQLEFLHPASLQPQTARLRLPIGPDAVSIQQLRHRLYQIGVQEESHRQKRVEANLIIPRDSRKISAKHTNKRIAIET